MRYLGGKSKIRKELSVTLESYRKENQTYFEPFVGGAWVLQEIKGERIASDGNKALVDMYKALQDGWIPPEFVSEDERKTWRKCDGFSTNPLQAFSLIGCGFGGDWAGGYARSHGKVCYAKTTKNSLLNQLPKIKDVKFIHGTFEQHKPDDMLVYCDPPYQGTTNYGAFDGFDHNLFWETMRGWSKNNTVLVSEYKAPDDFECVAEFKSRMGLRTKESGNELRVERLFKLRQ